MEIGTTTEAARASIILASNHLLREREAYVEGAETCQQRRGRQSVYRHHVDLCIISDPAMLKDELLQALRRREEGGILRGLKRFDIVHNNDGQQSSSRQRTNNANGYDQCGSISASQPHQAALVDFSSNDYLGMARSNELRKGLIRRLQMDEEALNITHSNPRFIGSTGSRLLDGNTKEHEDLEQRLKHYFGAPEALLFNSGYDANSSLLAVLPQPGDCILYDELVHASMHDGMRASRVQDADKVAFAHNDMQDMKRKLDQLLSRLDNDAATSSHQSKHQPNVFILVEAVYSMDGDACPLPELLAHIDQRLPRAQRCVIVDEAHSAGLYGLNGAGLCDALGVCDQVDVRLITFGKAFGCSGAAVLCESIVRLYLVNYARPLVYSTAIPNTSLYAINSALDILGSPNNGSARAMQTFELTQMFIDEMRKVMAACGTNDVLLTFPTEMQQQQSQTSQPIVPNAPILPIITSRARELAQFLVQRGFLVRPISYPTVPKGKERVRICIHAHNTPQQIRLLVEQVDQWLRTEVNGTSDQAARTAKAPSVTKGISTTSANVVVVKANL